MHKEIKSINKKYLDKIINLSLKEDKAFNDVTSDMFVDDKLMIDFEIKARENIIFCGYDVVNCIFKNLQKTKKFSNKKINLEFVAKDGEKIGKNKIIAKGNGNAKLIFAAERVMLNIIQNLSGISTATRNFVKKLNNKNIKILDTRKTAIATRMLQKYAVKIGGGFNHRVDLSEMILVKDNHIAVNGGVQQIYKNLLLKKNNIYKKFRFEIECDSINQVKESLKINPDIIMLDNMNVDEIKRSIKIIKGYKNKKILIEISGGVNLENIKNFSNLEIDFISIGSLTHSIRSVDIGLDIPSKPIKTTLNN